jgi:hypothetical protein
VVTAAGVGSVTIVATSGGKSGSLTIGVSAPNVDPPSSTASAGVAELPRALIDTRYVQPTGRTISVPSGGDLQGAINAAQRGDVIVLQAGGTYGGQFILTAKGGSAADGWITLRTSGTLPPEGTRVTPGSASALARIVSPDYRPAIVAAHGAAGWRLTGLEVTVSSTFGGQQYGLVDLGIGDETSMDQFARDIVLDRSWIHAQSNTDNMRCVAMNGIRISVIDSWLSDCHGRNGDSQAIASWNSPGPMKIADNYLEGAGENVMFGGSDPGVDGLVPSDITVTGNHFFKSLSWKGGPWQVKNLLELKNAQRVLVEGNVFQNSWAAAQDGWAFIWASHNQYGGSWGAWSVVRDVTFRYNRVDNVEGGFNLAERYDASATSGARFTIAQNLITNVGFSDSGDLDRLFLVSGNLADVAIEHNTGFAPTAYLQFGDGAATPKPRFTFRDNLGGNARYVYNSPLGDGAAMFTAYGVPLGNVVGNVIARSPSDGDNGFPKGNQYVGSIADIGFRRWGGPDVSGFALAPTSRHKGAAHNRTDAGTDIQELMKRTTSAVIAP